MKSFWRALPASLIAQQGLQKLVLADAGAGWSPYLSSKQAWWE